MEKNLYDVLGVSKDATKDQLKQQYRKLSKQYHPDMQNGKSDAEKKEAEEKFKEVSEAYATLSDDSKRAQYDQFGSVGNGQGFPGGDAGFNPFDFFRAHFGGSPFGFGSDFGFGEDDSPRRPQFDVNSPENGEDILAKISVPFVDMAFGEVEDFDIDKTEPCPKCNGTGVKVGTTPTTCKKCNGQGHITKTIRNGFMVQMTTMDCPECHGTGVVSDVCAHCHGEKRIHSKQHIQIRIPKGLQSGKRLRVAGAGVCGLKGGQNGNLYVQINVENCLHGIFKRSTNPFKSLDLEMTLPINPIVAAFGGTIDVETLWGKKQLVVNPRTSPGDEIVLKDCGLTDGSTHGDLIITINIAPFVKLSSEQENSLKLLLTGMSDKNVGGLVELKDDIVSLRS